MKVRELIAELQKMPMDAEVEVHTSDGDFEPINELREFTAGLVLIESDEEE